MNMNVSNMLIILMQNLVVCFIGWDGLTCLNKECRNVEKLL